MRRLLQIVILSTLIGHSYAQSNLEDSLRLVLQTMPPDTNRANLLIELARIYFFKHPDSCLKYSTQALKLSRELNFAKGVKESLFQQSEALHAKGDIIRALEVGLEWLKVSQETGDISHEANAMGFIGILYFKLEDYDHAASYLKKAIAARDQLEPMPALGLFKVYLGSLYSLRGQRDSAFFYINEVRDILKVFPIPQLKGARYLSLGGAFFRDRNLDSAEFYYRIAIKDALAMPEEMSGHLILGSMGLVELFELRNEPDSGFYYTRQAFLAAKKKHLKVEVYESSILLSKHFENRSVLDSALYYQRLATAMHDSIYGKSKYNELLTVVLREQERNYERQQTGERSRNRIIQSGLISIASIVVGASALLFRSYRKKQKANLALSQTLTELKSTQSQLIQSEKMASLGELTAGIAHEIQNPLNFVNNFSDLNVELIDDLKKEISTGDKQSAEQIADTLKENEIKINHHGKRADGIVKSMLQHSRTSAGQKELTDVNKLCDEYIRLAYHGFRAKDKSFNVTQVNIGIETDFDSTIPMLNIIPQDIGRVFLNLVNNAFYAVSEKSKKQPGAFEPIVKISTRNLKEKIEIRVKDNGTGIPHNIKEKIFQPFFTTKPAGQGTGLGLSLAYDIIAKAHGGELKVQSEEGAGCEFIILLPYSKNT